MSPSQQLVRVEGIDRESYASLLRLNPVGASPPTSTYITPDNQIAIFSTSSLAGVIVTLNARILLPDGTISLNQFSFPVPGGNVPASQQWSVPEGFLLTLSASTNTISGSRWAFVQVQLVQTRQNPPIFTSVLCSGYPSQTTPISFPGGLNLNTLDCAGNVRTVVATTPAAGNFVAITVPLNVRWRLISMSFNLATSAVVANRNVVVNLSQGGSLNFILLVNTSPQPASTGWTYELASGLSQFTSVTVGFASAPLPTWQILNQADIFNIVVSGMDPGDQITSINLSIEEWVCP